jgi:hypothetical protein
VVCADAKYTASPLSVMMKYFLAEVVTLKCVGRLKSAISSELIKLKPGIRASFRGLKVTRQASRDIAQAQCLGPIAYSTKAPEWRKTESKAAR